MRLHKQPVAQAEVRRQELVDLVPAAVAEAAWEAAAPEARVP
jgi:hypothetical protein